MVRLPHDFHGCDIGRMWPKVRGFPGVTEEITPRLNHFFHVLGSLTPSCRPTTVVMTRWWGLRMRSSHGTTASEDSASSISLSFNMGWSTQRASAGLR